MVRIEQDGFYLNGMGEIVRVEKNEAGDYLDENLNLYLTNGYFEDDRGRQKYDLIAYIPKELHYNILKTINNYHKNEDYKRFIDREFKKETK